MFPLCFIIVAARQWHQSSAEQAKCRSKKWHSSMSSLTSDRNHRKTIQQHSIDVSLLDSSRTKKKDFDDVKLILAPMELLADHQFRKAIATVGGMHEAVHEFIRITSPRLEDIHGVLRERYNAKEMGAIPLAAQIMGGDPVAMEVATTELVHRYGAHRVDLNCGCPAKRVNGRGAGASLLRSPESIYEITRRMVDAAKDSDAIVSVKMRSGYDSTMLFEENIKAITEAGVRMLTVHPRTKQQAYSGKADWELIKRAKDIGKDLLEVVGNGDVTTAEHALRMLEYTGCDHVMIGRGAVANPWIFWDIRDAFRRRFGETGEARRQVFESRVRRTFETERSFYESYFRSGGVVDGGSSPKVHKKKIGRLKMIIAYSSTIPQQDKERILRFDGGGDARRYLSGVIDMIEEQYQQRRELNA